VVVVLLLLVVAELVVVVVLVVALPLLGCCDEWDVEWWGVGVGAGDPPLCGSLRAWFT
jgi:hypothetical protein